MSLQQFRKDYPQYDDLNDEQLVTGLHKKHYADIPIAEFQQKIGYVKPHPIPPSDPNLRLPQGMTPTTGSFQQPIAPPSPAPTREQPLTPETQLKRASWTDTMLSPLKSWPDIARSMTGGVLSLRGEEARRVPTHIKDGKIQYDVKPLPEYAKVGAQMYVDAQKAIASKKPEDMGFMRGLVYDTEMMLLKMAPVVAGGVASRGNIMAALAPMYAQVRGERYTALRDAGFDHEKAALHSEMAAVIETGTETIPIGWMMKRGTPFVKRIIQGTVGEGLQESASSALQSAWDKGTISPDMSFNEALRAAGYEGLIGTLGGAGMSAAFHPFFKEMQDAAKTPNYPPWRANWTQGQPEVGKLWPDMVTMGQQEWLQPEQKETEVVEPEPVKQITGWDSLPPSLQEKVQEYTDGQKVGTLGDFLQTEKLQKLYKDVLDIPVRILKKPIQDHKYVDPMEGTAFRGAFGKVDGTPTILINNAELNEVIPTLLEEGAHALRTLRGRMGEGQRIPTTEEEFDAYEQRPEELTAARMVKHAQAPVKEAKPKTDDFKTWFGDSKIVDKQGKPLVVYHGSGDANITKFDPMRAGQEMTSDWGRGVYFTMSRHGADYYRKEALTNHDPVGDKLWDEYEAATNKYGTSPMYEWMALGSKEDAESQRKYKEIKAVEKIWSDHRDKIREGKGGKVYAANISMQNPMVYEYVGITDPYLPEIAKGQGHDGIIIINEPWTKGDLADYIDEVVVFDPSQIRLVEEADPLDQFVDIAKESKDGADFIEKIKDVPTTRETSQAFRDKVDPKHKLTPEQASEKFVDDVRAKTKKKAVKVDDKKLQSQIANLYKVADNMQSQIDNKMNPAVSHQNMTARRARIANSMREDGEQMIRVQSIMRGIGIRLNDGTIDSSLAGIKNKKQVEILESNSNPKRNEAARDWKRIGDEAHTTLKRAGINGKNYKKALREARKLIEGPSPEQIKANELRKLEQSLIGTKIAGFFPTPKDAANNLIDKADIQPDDTVLEPSAGMGSIADVIREQHPNVKLDVNEINYTLNELLTAKGYESTQNDFLDMTGSYDKIVMNPPFEKLQDIDHVKHAYELLAPDGRLVSIMSPSPFYRSDKKAKAFRDWFDDVDGVVEDMEAGTFDKAELVRTTGVGSKVVTIDKPISTGTKLYANPIQPMIEGYAKAADKTYAWLESKFAPWSALGRLPNQNVYLKKRYRTLGKLTNLDEVADKISKVFDKANQADQQSAYEYLTNINGDATTITDSTVRHHAVAVKKLINKTGRAMVDKSIIPQESFDKYAGQYLPRVYLKYLLGESAFRSLGTGAKISDQGYAKKRQDIPEDIRQVVLGEITDPAYLAARAVTVPARDMAIMEFLEDLSHYQEWVLPRNVANIVIDKNFRVKVVPERSRIPHKRVSSFWLKNESERLAEQALHMNEDVAKRTRQMAKDYGDIANEMLQGVVPDNFKQVPNTARYGALRGLYVRKEIFDDLIGTGKIMGEAGGMAERLLGQGGYATKATQAWKMSKVALNYPTQVRNFVSNGILLHLSGVPFDKVPSRVISAIGEMRKNGKHYRIAKKWGVKAASFSSNELLRIERHMLKVKAAQEGKFGIHHLLDLGAGFLNFHGDVYQLSESLFKTAKIIDAMEREGMSESDAAMAAQEALFDYSLIPQNIKFLRNNPIGIPFATFYYKASAQLAKTAIKHPARFAPYVALPVIMRSILQNMQDVDDDDYETLKLSLPEWLQERGGGYFLPVKDEHGRWQAVSIGYFFPWQMHVEFAREMASTLEGKPQAGEILQTTGLLGGPIPELIAALKTGKDSFTGRDIVNDSDPPNKKLADLMSYLWRLSMPTYMTDMGAIGHTLKALDGYKDPRKVFYGDPKYTVPQALARFIGVNIYPVDPAKSRADNMRRMKFEIMDLKKRYIQRMRDPNIKGDVEERQKLTKWYTNEMAVRALQLNEYSAKTKGAKDL